MAKTTTGKQEILSDLEKRVKDKILEQSNFDLLKRLVEKADTLDEAIKIAELGTTYKRTGFHFDKRLDKEIQNTISYFKKNNALSFETDQNAITHKLIVGDNYPALLNLLVEYKGKIDVIYIDPPYGKDNMGEFADTNYDNAITRDNLLSMLYPRLMVAKQLLSDSGVIFCSIDDRNQAYVKCLFDEAFGEGNFVNKFIWVNNIAGRQITGVGAAGTHEEIYCYAKDIFQLKEFTADNIYLKKIMPTAYKGFDFDIKKDGKGEYVITHELHNGNSAFNEQTRPNLVFDIWYREKDSNVKFTNPNDEEYIKIEPHKNVDGIHKYHAYRWSKEKILAETDDLEFVKDKNTYRIYTKRRDFATTMVKDLITDISTSNGNLDIKSLNIKGFDFPKPVILIKHLLKIASNETSIILDFFAGSGTTGQAVLELNKEDKGNRQFILATNNEKTDTTPNGIAVDVTSKRLKRVMTGKCYDGTNNFEWVKKNKPLGDNLEVLDIAEVSNFEAVSGKTAFDVIDETLYGNKKFAIVKEKVEWVCNNFEVTQKRLEEK